MTRYRKAWAATLCVVGLITVSCGADDAAPTDTSASTSDTSAAPSDTSATTNEFGATLADVADAVLAAPPVKEAFVSEGTVFEMTIGNAAGGGQS